ncbi:MAG: hypothetical protein ABJA79_05345 [Parafilimonas sp.]
MKPAIFKIFYKAFLYTAAFFFASSTSAQVFIETYPAGKGKNPPVLVYGRSTLPNEIPYDKVKGSAFWNSDWQLASLYGNNAKEKWFCKSKLNLVTGEVYFLNKNGEEKVADKGLIKMIVYFKNNDTSTMDAVFAYTGNYPDLQVKQKSDTYLQILNSGKHELLKLYKRSVASADSLFGTLKRYYFATEINYFIHSNQKTEAIKKLNKETVLHYIPNSSSGNDWINQNKIDLRKEKDVIEFLNYYNANNL